MIEWLSAQYDPALKSATYSDNQSLSLVKSGGSLPWRLHNPGNLRPRLENGRPAPLRVTRHIGFAETRNPAGVSGYFLIFPDYGTGVDELRNNLRRMHGDNTLAHTIAAFAPPSENDTPRYLSQVRSLTGMSAEQIIGDLNPARFEQLVQAIILQEGYQATPNGPRNEHYRQRYEVQTGDTLSTIASRYGQRLMLELEAGAAVLNRSAPWMDFAYGEAALWQGKDESEITRVHNYHRMVYPGRGLPSLVGDSNPWCAAFVHYCLKQAGFSPALDFEASNAVIAEKTRFGEIPHAVYGAICYTPRSGGGHVCFVVGSTSNGKTLVLGGNQENKISFEPKSTAQARFFLPSRYLAAGSPAQGASLVPADLAALQTRYGAAVCLTGGAGSS